MSSSDDDDDGTHVAVRKRGPNRLQKTADAVRSWVSSKSRSRGRFLGGYQERDAINLSLGSDSDDDPIFASERSRFEPSKTPPPSPKVS